MTMSAPRSPGAVVTAKARGFAPTIRTEGAIPRMSARSSWNRPKKFGFSTYTAAVSSPTALFRATRSIVPVSGSYGTSTTWRPGPTVYDSRTLRFSQWSARGITICFFPVIRWAMRAASPRAVDPSYIDVFAASIPVSSQIKLWYSQRVWRIPWLSSGWYGV